MSTTPPGGPQGPNQPPEPKKLGEVPKLPKGQEQEQPSMLNSPFAKMFERMGITPTAKQIHMMMSNLLRQTLTEIKRDDKRWKEAMKKLKKEIEGKE